MKIFEDLLNQGLCSVAVALGSTCQHLRNDMCIVMKRNLITMFGMTESYMDTITSNHEVVIAFFHQFFCESFSCNLQGDSPLKLRRPPNLPGWGFMELVNELDNEKLIVITHDTVRMYFVGKVGSTNQKWLQDILCSADAVARQCRSGHRVPITKELLNVYRRIVPSGPYWVESPVGRFTPVVVECSKIGENKILRQMEQTLKLTFQDWGMQCVGPRFFAGHMDHQGSVCYSVEGLRLFAFEMHPCHDQDRVNWYVKRMTEDKDYIPTVVLFCPSFTDFSSSMGVFSSGALVLDGHHKLAAACKVRGPLRFVLFRHTRDSGDASVWYPCNYERYEDKIRQLAQQINQKYN